MQAKNKFLSYLRYYRDEDVPDDFSWWYCLIDCKIYETQEIYRLFGYSSKEEIYATSFFVEFDKVDVIEVKKRYLAQKICAKEYKSWDFLPDQSFDIKFNKYIDCNNLIQEWSEFETKALQLALNKWELTNGVVLGGQENRPLVPFEDRK